jgi:glycosyltransferase involved in cell wall biosynthesis
MREYLTSLLPAPIVSSVKFHGHVSREQLEAAFRSAAAAVFPSYAEAFAIAPLEAMAGGCPTIYSIRGSGPEALEDGKEGVLVDPDRPEELASAIIRLLSDRGFAECLGEAGRRRIGQHFSLPAQLLRNVEFYGTCIEEFHATNRN